MANPLKPPTCTMFRTFLRPSTPPHAILKIFWNHLFQRHCTILTWLSIWSVHGGGTVESIPCHFKILLAPRGEGPGKGAIFGDLSTLTLNLTQPRKRLGTHLRSDMSSCHLSDLMQVVNSMYQAPSLTCLSTSQDQNWPSQLWDAISVL